MRVCRRGCGEAFAGDTNNKKRLLKEEVASSIKTVV